MKKFIKKIYHPSIKKKIFVNNIIKICQIRNRIIYRIKLSKSKKKYKLLQDRLKNNEKSVNQFQNGLRQIRKIRVKRGKRKDLSQAKKIQNIVNNIFQNKIKQILIYYKIYSHK